jgi:hypothetical protein
VAVDGAWTGLALVPRRVEGGATEVVWPDGRVAATVEP